VRLKGLGQLKNPMTSSGIVGLFCMVEIFVHRVSHVHGYIGYIGQFSPKSNTSSSY
jgi:hypothetical protein